MTWITTHFKIGMRTLKTAIAVCMTTVIFVLLDRPSPNLALIAVVFSIRTDASTSLKFGRLRIFGNTLGILIAYMMLQLGNWLQLPIEVIHVGGATLGIIIVIIACTSFNMGQSVIATCAAFFIVLVGVEHSSLPIYIMNRLIDTIIGASVGMLTDILLPNPTHKRQKNNDAITIPSQPRSNLHNTASFRFHHTSSKTTPIARRIPRYHKRSEYFNKVE